MIRYLKWAWEVILFFIPRFITEDVVVNTLPNGDYEIICAIQDVEPDEEFDGIATVNSFAFMFWGFLISIEEVNGLEVRPFERKS